MDKEQASTTDDDDDNDNDLVLECDDYLRLFKYGNEMLALGQVEDGQRILSTLIKVLKEAEKKLKEFRKLVDHTRDNRNRVNSIGGGFDGWDVY